MRHTADVFLVTPLDAQESMQITSILSCVPVAKLYTLILEDLSEPIPVAGDITDEIAMLLNIITQCNTLSGGVSAWAANTKMSVNGDTDWVKESNNLLPAAFSKLFVGDSNEKTQRICRGELS